MKFTFCTFNSVKNIEMGFCAVRTKAVAGMPTAIL